LKTGGRIKRYGLWGGVSFQIKCGLGESVSYLFCNFTHFWHIAAQRRRNGRGDGGARPGNVETTGGEYFFAAINKNSANALCIGLLS